MKRNFCILSLGLLLLTLLFCSCHGSNGLEEFVMPEEFDTNRQYEISFWAKNDTNLTQVKIYEKAIADFEALYPNIKVNLRLYTNYGTIYNDVITNISTGTTPNVCITYPDHIATYNTGKGIMVALNDLMNDPQYGLGGSSLRFDSPTLEELVPKFLAECALGDMYYALPHIRHTEACYINKTYVEALGYTVPDILTWDFIWEVSEAAMAKDENGIFLVNGQEVMLPFLYKSTDNMMISMLKQKGAPYSTDAGEILLFNDTTISLLREIQPHAASRAFTTFAIVGYPANFLNAGQCIFAIDSTAGATWMGCEAPLIDISDDRLVEFETVVRMIPQYDPENPQMISQGPSVCVFNQKDPQEVLASWLFTQFLLTDEVQIAYAQTEGYIPVTSKAQSTEAYQTYLANEGIDNNLHYNIKLQATKLLLSQIDNTFVTPVFNGSASLRNAAGQLVENVTKSARRNQTIDDAYFVDLQERLTTLYRLDESGQRTSFSKQEFGSLPLTSVILLSALGITWPILLIANMIRRKKSKKVENNS